MKIPVDSLEIARLNVTCSKVYIVGGSKDLLWPIVVCAGVWPIAFSFLTQTKMSTKVGRKYRKEKVNQTKVTL